MKRLVCILVIVSLVLSFSIPAAADTKQNLKEESVFAILNNDGSIKDGFVVNGFDGGEIVDFGDYSKVINMTDSVNLVFDDGRITTKTNSQRFYYQGILKNPQLPWNVKVEYILDGEKIAADSLLGKSGELEIHIDITDNKNINPAFFENYAMQITVTLNEDICENISSKGATIANAGKDKMINYMVLPGKESKLKIDTKVNNFEMVGIEFAATPLSMMIDLPDISGMMEEMESLTDAISMLDFGIGEIVHGMKELSNGANALVLGSEDFRSGQKALNNSSGQLLSASASIKAALTEIANAAGEAGDISLEEISILPEALRRLSGGLEEIANGLTQLKQGYNAGYGALQGAILAIPDDEIDPTALYAAVYGQQELMAMLDKLIEYYAAAKTVKGTYVAVSPALDAVDETLDTVASSIEVISTQISAIAKGIEDSFSELGEFSSKMEQLIIGLTQLSENYGSLHTGLVRYMGGVGGLVEGYEEINSGIIGFKEGVGLIYNGTTELKDGSKELNDAVSNLPELIEEEIQKLLAQYDKGDYKAVSFVSDKNASVKSVQFAFKTEGIKAEDIAKTPPVEEVKLSFWQKILKLFGLYR